MVKDHDKLRSEFETVREQLNRVTPIIDNKMQEVDNRLAELLNNDNQVGDMLAKVAELQVWRATSTANNFQVTEDAFNEMKQKVQSIETSITLGNAIGAPT